MCGFLAFRSKEISKVERDSFDKILYRGPDQSRLLKLEEDVVLGFHRLSIMDLSTDGMQPFQNSSKDALICNGEIYNYQQIKDTLLSKEEFISKSDCEVILPLYKKFGLEKLCKNLDGEFAFVIWDSEKQTFQAARDQFGIRPLFYGYKREDSSIAFASEVKALQDFCDDIKPFLPGHYFDGRGFYEFDSIHKVEVNEEITKEDALHGIKQLLEQAVIKRMDSDAKVGYLLSGGLDSSLVCAIAARESKEPIKTFAVGINEDPIDAKYAKIVADHIGSDHTEYLFSKSDLLETLDDLIYRLESFDITTIRASLGMDLICRHIKDTTDIKVLMTGECSDEMFGYKYTDFAPSPNEFQKEASKRVEELYIYDVLRADRCISSNSLEARVPFSDKSFAKFVMSIPPELKMNTTGHGKYLLRAAFDLEDYLPQDILFRQKAAFSDAVGHSSVDFLKTLAEITITEDELAAAKELFPHCTPTTKESFLYRRIFEKHYPSQSHLIKAIWLPNQEWENCKVSDPSARALPNYGKSGL
ncbi:asparagine synthase B [Halobacteriovorax sp. JY17]|uniref:asparagine synthase B n=1 Tax=Halobacteriovorax sp. JY17 TaxID=2014617 RepID=UPI000C5FC3E3|nr:asparagine synthase B [Halobacteriovorax sp. JY17]PIK14374.1 MAG: asparagine synthetase B [Halobacteriovorax sp. JY17]